jgi:hypothetical protein
MIYLLLACYTLAPVISVLIAGAVAKLAGATVDESGPHPCYIFGIDIGGLLSSMLVLGWLGLITLPTGGLAILVFSFLRLRVTRSSSST